MMQLTITDAGRAALVNAANTGTLPITLDKVVLGSALYSPVATQTALQAPLKTIITFGADAVADDTIHITITDESADEYNLGEIGIYAGTTLFGIYSQSTPILEKGASQMVLLSADIQFTSVPVNSITVGDTSFAYPQATETRMGVMKIATPDNVSAGTDHTSAVTPKTLKQEVSTRLGKTENAVSASKLATPRAIKLTGDASGEASFDGSGNISIIVNVADNSHAHIIGNVEGLQIALDAKLPTTGNAASASKLATPRVIKLIGDASGEASFDGSGNISIIVDVADNSHAHIIGNVEGLQAALDAKLPTTGNAASASKLATPRVIKLIGDASGEASFDGSGNISIIVDVADNSHAHIIGNVEGLQDELDNKLPTTGNAASASKLATARSISLSGAATGSAAFDGSGNITIPVSLTPSESIQPGMVFATAQNSVPTGYLECNGAAVSRKTYAALYARIGNWFGYGDGLLTFNLPDLRGVFIRGFDNARGLDAGRVHGTYQDDAFQGHGHLGVSVVGYGGGWGDQNTKIGNGVTESAGTTDKGYGTPRIASETRPKNVAMRYCIKY